MTNPQRRSDPSSGGAALEGEGGRRIDGMMRGTFMIKHAPKSVRDDFPGVSGVSIEAVIFGYSYCLLLT